MAKKKRSTKKSTQKKVVIENMEEVEEHYIPKAVEKNEDRQFFWFIVIILLVFASFLGPYFYLESKKSFEFENIYWKIESRGELEIYHGMFEAFTGKNSTHNIFLRVDPRENDVPTSGKFDKFTKTGFISITPDFERCAGQGVYRSIVDLSLFLRSGIGMSGLEGATTSVEKSKKENLTYADCTNTDKTVIILQIGNESLISQSNENPLCYTLQMNNCEDIATIEKFIVKTHSDIYDLLGYGKKN